MDGNQDTMVDAAIFHDLQRKVDEDIEAREQIRNILQTLEKQGRVVQSILSRAHSTPSSKFSNIVADAEACLVEQAVTISALAVVASKFPYYKYNGMWTRDIQDAIYATLFCAWLGGLEIDENPGKQGRFLTIEEVGKVLGVPVNLRVEDAFHVSLEEYLHALISLIDELTRLAVNSVTLGDFAMPVQICQFVKDIHAGFQILNLKNDALRRRSDSVKYSVSKLEGVVYDLSLRNLVPDSEKPT